VNDRLSSRRRPLRGSPGTATLNPPVRNAVRRFVRLLAGSGWAPKAIEKEVAKTCRRIPRSRPFAAHRRQPGSAGRVLTLWLSDPAYLDPHGRPRPLPLRGARLSMETLARRVDPQLDVSHVLRYLEDGDGVKRVGSRYVPRNRELVFRDRMSTTGSMQGLFGLLQTLERNQSFRTRISRRPQPLAQNPSLTVSAVGPFKNRLGQLSGRLLARLDAEMERCEKARRKRQRRVRVGVGIYRYQERPVARGRRRPMIKRHGKSRAR